MKKIRSDAKWAGMSPKQCKALEQWLFDENLSYAEAHARAKEKLGFTGSKAGIQRFYQRKDQERMLLSMTQSCRESDEIDRFKADGDTLQSSAMKILRLQFFQGIKSGAITDLPTMARLLLHNESNEIQREENDIRRESVALRQKSLDFHREKWEFDLVERAKNMIPELQDLKDAEDEAKDPYHENKRLNAIRIRMFGKDIPDLFPESEEEEQQEKERRKKDYYNTKLPGGGYPLEPDQTPFIRMRKEWEASLAREAAQKAAAQAANAQDPERKATLAKVAEAKAAEARAAESRAAEARANEARAAEAKAPKAKAAAAKPAEARAPKVVAPQAKPVEPPAQPAQDAAAPKNPPPPEAQAELPAQPAPETKTAWEKREERLYEMFKPRRDENGNYYA